MTYHQFGILIFTIGLIFTASMVSGCAADMTTNGQAIDSTPTTSITPSEAFTTPSKSTPTTSATFIAIPSEVISDQNIYLNWLFSLNKKTGCEIPCWWGLVPGNAEIDAVRQLFQPFEPVEADSPFGNGVFGIGFYSAQTDFGHLITTAFFDDHEYVGMEVLIPVQRLSSDGILITKNLFAMDAILSEFGEPTEVLVSLRLATADPGSGFSVYEIWLIYPAEGIMVGYTGEFKIPPIGQQEFLVCPDFAKLERIEIYLQEPGTFEQTLRIDDFRFGESSGLTSMLQNNSLIPWEVATELTKSDFLDLYKNHQAACFGTQFDVWNHVKN